MDPILRDRVAQLLLDEITDDPTGWAKCGDRGNAWSQDDLVADVRDLAEMLWLAGFIKDDA